MKNEDSKFAATSFFENIFVKVDMGYISKIKKKSSGTHSPMCIILVYREYWITTKL